MPKETAKKKDQKVEERRHHLDDSKKEHMLAVVIRNKEAHDAVRELLTVGQVKRWSPALSWVWYEVRTFYDKYATLPKRGQLSTLMQHRATTSPDTLSPEAVEQVNEFIEYAWDVDEHGKKVSSPSEIKFAVDTCRTFLEENVAHDIHQSVIREGTLPLDIPKLLDDTRMRLDMVQSLTDVDVGVPFPAGWDKRADQQLFTSGVPALDKFMGGGWKGGEVVLFMGPYGSCKTTLVCHGVANQLVYAAGLLAEGKARKNTAGEMMIPVVVLIFSESDKNEYRDRLMSHMARVPWKRLTQMQGVASLGDGDGPGQTPGTKYEEREFKKDVDNGKPWLNEQQRVQQAAVLANKHLMLIDCTDAEDSPHDIGRGGIPEIASIVKGIFRKKKKTHYPITFWVDHVSGVIDRMAESMVDEKVIHRTLTNIPRVAADTLAKPFNASVCLMHQFSGAAQNKGTTAQYHHSDSEGSKSIGKYAVFAFVSGPVDSKKMCQWGCTKHRREPPSQTRIIKVEGQFNRLKDCTDSHGVGVGSRTIMTKKELGQAGSNAKAPAGYKKAGGGKFSDNLTEMN